MRSTVLQDSSSAKRRAEGSFGVAGASELHFVSQSANTRPSGYRVHCRDCRQRFRSRIRPATIHPRSWRSPAATWNITDSYARLAYPIGSCSTPW